MKIVIDIDDNLYTRLFDNGVDNYDDIKRNGYIFDEYNKDVTEAITKGAVLKETPEREKHDSIELFGAMTLLAGTIGAFENDKKQMEAIPGGMLFSEKLRELQEELQAEISMNLLDSLKRFAENSEEEDVDEE